MKWPFLFLVLFILTGTLFANDVEVQDAWIRAVPPSSGATAAFMIIANKGEQPATLIEGKTPLSPEVKPMITTKKKIDGREVMGMEFVRSFTIAPHEKRILEPGGDHMMLMKLKKIPSRGDNVPLTLIFESGGKREEVHLNVPVR